MVELDFNPRVGDRVEVGVSDEPCEIVDRHTGAAGEFLLKLRRLRDGMLFENVQPIMVSYPADERVRRELKKILAKSNSLPEDFQQEMQPDVKFDPMYDGTPRIMVYFHLKPGVAPSVTKARVWSDFYALLREKLQPLMDSETWLQFAAKEDRSTLRAAS